MSVGLLERDSLDDWFRGLKGSEGQLHIGPKEHRVKGLGHVCRLAAVD